VTCFDGLCVQASWSRVRPSPRTWPSLFPFLALDRIFVSPAVEVESVFSPRDPLARIASDHLPVVAVLRVGTP
jgi:endonuclease/exonuclease/phosphatase family metal-dependent hydrolase